MIGLDERSFERATSDFRGALDRFEYTPLGNRISAIGTATDHAISFGFDRPVVDFVIVARPSTSTLQLYVRFAEAPFPACIRHIDTVFVMNNKHCLDRFPRLKTRESLNGGSDTGRQAERLLTKSSSNPVRMPTREHTCCTVSRSRGADETGSKLSKYPGETSVAAVDTSRMVRVPAGSFRMGTDDDIGFAEDGEGPAREVTTNAYYTDKHAVTNAEFYEFVKETDYTTDAERYGWSYVFQDFVGPELEPHVLNGAEAAPWWVGIRGAYWARPEGPGSSVEDRLDHPVVHVSWNDAVAYCDWADKRLPTEAEWERAARGGKEGAVYPWGDELHPGGEHRCNIWQGDFPDRDTAADGYHGTAPVDSFHQNEFDMYNVSGNVWEWCNDWFSSDYHVDGPREDPTGPEDGQQRVIRGGSYLCHRSYCNRYRVAARTKNTPDSSTGHIGFRCVADAES